MLGENEESLLMDLRPHSHIIFQIPTLKGNFEEWLGLLGSPLLSFLLLRTHSSSPPPNGSQQRGERRKRKVML